MSLSRSGALVLAGAVMRVTGEVCALVSADKYERWLMCLSMCLSTCRIDSMVSYASVYVVCIQIVV